MEPEIQATTPNVPAEAKPAANPAADPAKAAAEPTVTITVAQYQAQVERDRKWAEVEAAQAAELAKREDARIKAMAEKGDVEKALAETRSREEKRYRELEEKHTGLLQSLAAKERDIAIGMGVAGRRFVGEDDATRAKAAATFQRIAADKFAAAQDEQGRWVVKDPNTGRPASEVLPELIAEHSYLFAANTQGGVNGGGGALNANGGKEPTGVELYAAQVREQKKREMGFGLSRVG